MGASEVCHELLPSFDGYVEDAEGRSEGTCALVHDACGGHCIVWRYEAKVGIQVEILDVFLENKRNNDQQKRTEGSFIQPHTYVRYCDNLKQIQDNLIHI